MQILLKTKSLKKFLKLSNEELSLTLLCVSLMFREFHKVTSAMANVLMSHWLCSRSTTSTF